MSRYLLWVTYCYCPSPSPPFPRRYPCQGGYTSLSRVDVYNREDSNRDRINYFTIDFRNQAGTNDAVSYTFTGAQVWGFTHLELQGQRVKGGESAAEGQVRTGDGSCWGVRRTVQRMQHRYRTTLIAAAECAERQTDRTHCFPMSREAQQKGAAAGRRRLLPKTYPLP